MYIHACVREHISVSIYIYIYIYIGLCVCVCVCVCVYVWERERDRERELYCIDYEMFCIVNRRVIAPVSSTMINEGRKYMYSRRISRYIGQSLNSLYKKLWFIILVLWDFFTPA